MKTLLTIIVLTLSLGAFADPDGNLVDCSCKDAPTNCDDRSNNKLDAPPPTQEKEKPSKVKSEG